MLLGIDLGTSSVRAAIVGEDGRIRGLGAREYAIHSPRPGQAEQPVADWWQGTVAAVRQALSASGSNASDVRGISFSGQMHGTVLVDRVGEALAPAIIWADARSASQAERLNACLGDERLAAIAGNRISPGFMAATLAWLAEERPSLLAAARYSLLPKDWLRLRLTGEPASEPSDASASLLFDITRLEWSPELCAAAGVSESLLPPIVSSASIAGRLLPGSAEELGLVAGTPVAAGAGDQAAQAVGNGVITSGLGSVTVGTGGQLLHPADAPTADPRLRVHCFCHAVPGRWYVMAAMLSAGLALRWWRDLLGMRESDAYAILDDEASMLGPGAEGLLFLPYLLGERTPHMDPAARGAFLGLSLRHRRGHLARAVMEGVAFALRDGLEVLGELGRRPRQLVASGGGARSPLWRRILADVLGIPLVTVGGDERAVVGAAIIAGVATGAYDSFEQARDACVHYCDVVSPSPAHEAAYDVLYAHFRTLYPVLRDHMRFLSDYAASRQTATEEQQ